MKKTTLAAIITAVLYVSGNLSAATYGGGDGSPETPFQIWTPQQMNTIGVNSGDWDKYFILMANIDMSIYTGTQYNIIGTDWNNPFTGTFDGKGYVISNLTYTTTAVVDFVGLFGSTENATIQNLGVENVSLTSGGRYIGGLVGDNWGAAISCYVTGSVSGNSDVGGLMGNNWGTITSCYATGSVTGSSSDVGGLVGFNFGPLTSCYAVGSVSGNYIVGGLVGRLDYGTLIACYATGAVSGTSTDYYSSVGGLVGWNNGGMITACYATGSVTGTDWTVGGLAGLNDGTLTACFWDMETSGQETSHGGEGKTTVEMMTLSTFTSPPASWDFTNETINGTNDYWMMLRENEDYPRLAWQEIFTGDIAGLYGINLADFEEIAAHWGQIGCPTGCENADINGDGTVDMFDLISLADNWLEGV
jgi:hypothetical protein